MNTTTQFNDKRRHELVGIPYNEMLGPKYDIRSYHGLTFENLQALIQEGYADPDETQNDSPPISEFADFLKNNRRFRAHGYIVTPNRDDVRVSIEGVEADYCPKDSLDAFIQTFRHADEFSLNPPRCWYD